MSILLPIGTRPEAIKCLPIYNELLTRDCDVVVFPTSQNYSAVKLQIPNMLQAETCEFDFPKGLLSGLFRLKYEIERSIKNHSSKIVVSIGDTTTAFASVLAAKSLGVRSVHVEAGMRTGDITSPFPEEFFRRAIDQLSDSYVCCHDYDRSNIEREFGKITDLLVAESPIYDELSRPINSKKEVAENQVLIDLHRRELSEVDYLMFIEHIVTKIGSKAKFIILESRRFKGCENDVCALGVQLEDSKQHSEFVSVLKRSKLVISDSGTLQEECFAYSIPHLIFRERTERPYLVDGFTSQLLGTNPVFASDIATQTFLELPLNQVRCRPNRKGGSGKIADFIVRQSQI